MWIIIYAINRMYTGTGYSPRFCPGCTQLLFFIKELFYTGKTHRIVDFNVWHETPLINVFH